MEQNSQEKPLDYNVRQKEHEDGSRSVLASFLDNRDLETMTELHCFVSKVDGTRIWHLGAVPHHPTGPALINTQRSVTEGKYKGEPSQDWIINGKYHRVNGPAIIREHGYSYWKNGFRHRYDGPASVDNEKNIVKWFVNNKEIKDIESILSQHDLNPLDYENWTDAERAVVRFALS